MSQLPPLPVDQRQLDADHLKLLAIFHFIGAGLALLGLLFLCAHFAMMHIIFENPGMWANQKSGPPPAIFFAIFKWLYLIFGTWLLISAVLNMISGLCLNSRKCRTFSVVVGGINCLHLPLGTLLGIFTVIVLMRPSVRELYATQPRA